MQEEKDSTRPVRIRKSVLANLEKIAIEESSKRAKLLTIPEIVDEILKAEIQKRLQD